MQKIKFGDENDSKTSEFFQQTTTSLKSFKS